MSNTINLIGKYGKDCKIFLPELDEDSTSFLYTILNNEVSLNSRLRVMPDCHSGVGCIVGLTMEITGKKINPNHIGCDIGCGILYGKTKTKLTGSEDLGLINHKIRKLIPLGADIQDHSVIQEKDLFRFLRDKYNTARSLEPNLINPISSIDEKFIKEFLRRIKMEPGMFYKSLGTLGGGNHFIEISKDPEDILGVTIHCGSRNLGIKVWKYWTKGRRDYLEGDELRGYLSDMCICQAYASYNRKTILDLITSSLRWKLSESIESVHNYIDFSDLILRKGSTPAYLDQKVIIPLNMRDGSIICRGKENPDWNYSSPHGAGRLFSRAKAKLNFTLEQYKKEMKSVFSTSVSLGTLDEAPMAYKDSDFIKNSINDTVDILYQIYPIINIKDNKKED